MRAFQDAGMNVPADVSVMGFDGTEVADHTHPRLSTVVVPLHEIGATGMRLLLRQIDGTADVSNAGEPPLREILPAHVKIQESTAAPRVDSNKKKSTKVLSY